MKQKRPWNQQNTLIPRKKMMYGRGMISQPFQDVPTQPVQRAVLNRTIYGKFHNKPIEFEALSAPSLLSSLSQ
jgi:hypothetical protein